MRPEAWSQVDELFHAALEMVPTRRAAFLRTACDGNEVLRSEVESLLTNDSREWDLLAASALESAAILLADEPPQLTPGETIAHYEIKDLLGQGGMGQVYLARDQILDRMIALKLLPGGYTQDHDRLRRFEREARTISALNHPNILTVHEFGSFRDQRFIATEFVDGETLRERLKRGPIPVGEVIDIGCQLAGALAAAHGAGVIHRDIKPENIMLRPDGYVKILDFGLAKLSEVQEPVVSVTTVPENDISSMLLLGTPRYMSPEQIRRSPLDPRSDIFSMGAVLYEMVTARPAFGAKDHGDLAHSILNDDPPPITNVVKHIPASLSAVITKMLSKGKDDRYQSADEVLNALKGVRAGLDSNVDSAALDTYTASHRRGLIMAVAILGLTIIIFGGYVAFKRSSGQNSSSASSSHDVGGWLAKAPLSSPRSSAGLAVLDDELYAIGGLNGCTSFSDVEVYDPGRDVWVKHAPLPTARGGLGVAVLDGQIYSVGGKINCDSTVATVEAYDAKADRWSTRTPTPFARAYQSLVAVNGKLFSIGGRSGSGEPLALNTQYDPQTDSWTEMAPMPTPRMGAGVVALNDLIYVIGGTGGGRPHSTVEVYDTNTNSWTTARSMLHPRDFPAVSELDGAIYSIGGSPNQAGAEIYDPGRDTWAEVTGLPSGRYLAHAIAFNESIYIAGGFDGVNYLSSVLSFNNHSSPEQHASKCPSLRVVSKAQMPAARHGMTVGVIGGVAYVMGGFRKGSSFVKSFLSSSEAYDPITNSWAEKAPMPSLRETSGSNSAVVGEKLYVIGGNAEGQCTNLNQVYDPAMDRWSTKTPMPTARCHLAVIAHNGLIYAIGGVNTSSTIRFANVEVYDPANDSWSTVPPMPTARYYPGAASLNGLIYVVGGWNPASGPDDMTVVEVFDPVKREWTRRSPMIEGRRGMAIAVINGKIVIFGGVNGDRFLSTAEIYDPQRDNWTWFETGATPRADCSAVTIDDTLYIFGGHSTDAPESLPTNEAFTLSECMN